MRLPFVIFALLALSACGASAQTPAVDTRALSAFGFDSTAVVTLDSLARVAAPAEVGMCLHGHVIWNARGHMLRIDSVTRGDIHEADSVHVSYMCDMNDPDFVGVAHSHTQPTALCIPSDEDFLVLIDEDANRVQLSVIRCLAMTSDMPNAYAQLRDGRWTWLWWPQ